MLLVAGARPNFIKIAPILRALRSLGHRASLIHTGQHSDPELSDTFFRELEIPDPDHHLGASSGSHAVQTAAIMSRFEPVLLEVMPEWVIVVGDVNSTLACALVAAKLKAELGCRIAHVEAGLRSNDWTMPEELNRVLTDRLSDLLLTPSADARVNLLREGIGEERIRFVGNVMIDTLYEQLPHARILDIATSLGMERENFALATLHRPSNVDAADRLAIILRGLASIAVRRPVLLPLHPRTRKNMDQFGLAHLLQPLRTVGPLPYRHMLSLTEAAAVVLTDSGGVQEESTVLGVPCVTLRQQTERPVTITEGTNRLVRWPMTPEGIAAAAEDAVRSPRFRVGEKSPALWDGKASDRIAAEISAFH